MTADFPFDFHVVVVGAGLVGLTTAILLRKAGYRVTVLERDVELREIGAGIQLPVNSCRVLRDAGVLSRVRDRAARPKAIVLRSYRDGALLREMNLDPYTQDKYGLPYLVIHRADLRRILYDEAVARGAQVRLGVTVDGQASDFANGVVRFSGSQEELRADLVVGADGPQSMCRAALVQRPNNPRPTGATVVRIVVPVSAIERDPALRDLVSPPSVQTWLGPRSLAVCYTLKDAFNVVLTRPATPDEVFIGPRPENVEQLRAFFRSWDPQMRRLLDIADNFNKWSLLEVDEPPASFVHPTGKFVLAGDSAHATLPYLAQGAAMGFESAAVLSHLLTEARTASDIPHLLRVYDSVRRPRTTLVIRASKRTGEVWQLPDGSLQVDRDRQFLEDVPPGVGYPNMLDDPVFQQWLFGFDAGESVRMERGSGGRYCSHL